MSLSSYPRSRRRALVQTLTKQSYTREEVLRLLSETDARPTVLTPMEHGHVYGTDDPVDDNTLYLALDPATLQLLLDTMNTKPIGGGVGPTIALTWDGIANLTLCAGNDPSTYEGKS